MSKNQINELNNKLVNSKVFVNMVIHDFRTPANQIEYAMNIALERVSEMEIFISKVLLVNF
jgi:hypothetical protein